ncbi:beta-1,6-N-acetylglucosaminyltransferase, partial [Rosenbergiella epipactidis]|uniref:beta-1,6-N-acetylglucosaminyltransferase n=1 Tax=Rosenbergiella epipactidis TaxID=1544694 RepID=UPI001F4D5669
NMCLYKGVQWFSLPKSSSELIVDFIVKNPSFTDVFSKSFCPDEIFFVSLLKNLNPNNDYHDSSKLNNALRYIDWKSGPDFPKIIHLEELNTIANRGYFFCRKVDRKIPLLELENYLRNYIG